MAKPEVSSRGQVPQRTPVVPSVVSMADTIESGHSAVGQRLGNVPEHPKIEKVKAFFSQALILFRIGVGSMGKWHSRQARLNCTAAYADVKNSSVSSICCSTVLEESGSSIQHKIDATAFRGIMLRRGTGGITHLQVTDLSVQEAVRKYGIQVIKIPREQNLAFDRSRSLAELSTTHVLQYSTLRASSALRLALPEEVC